MQALNAGFEASTTSVAAAGTPSRAVAARYTLLPGWVAVSVRAQELRIGNGRELRVQIAVGECAVDRGTGVRAIDAEICNLAHQRLRFRPALNRQGQAVAGWFGYRQTPPR